MPNATPRATEAERAVIGSMLIEHEAVERAKMVLRAEDFYVENHRHMFRAILAVAEEQSEGGVDIVTVIERLRSAGRLDEVGGPAALSGCMEAVGTAGHVEYYAKLVRRVSLERQIIAQAARVGQEASPEGVRELGDLVLASSGLRGDRLFDCRHDLHDIVDEILDPKTQNLHYTGFHALDDLLGGLEPGDLLTVGARTSGGKSALMLKVAYNMARAGDEVLFITTEMSKREIIERLLPMCTGIPALKFRAKNLSGADNRKVMEAMGATLSKLPLKILSKSRVGIEDIRAAGLQSKCQVLFYDYLQRSKWSNQESRAYAIEEFMVELKSFVSDAGIVGVTAAQLDRQRDKTKALPPELSDFRGSGAIESESTHCVLLWQPPPEVARKRLGWVEPTEGCTAIEARVAKNRKGPAGVHADLQLNGELVDVCERMAPMVQADPQQEMVNI